MTEGAHAKPGDVLVGRLTDPIGLWRDEVYLRDLLPEFQDAIRKVMTQPKRERAAPAPGSVIFSKGD